MSSMECDFCGSTEVVMTAGYHYCRPCERKNIDQPVLDTWISRDFPLIPYPEVHAALTRMFGTEDYGFHNLGTIGRFAPRGEWSPEDGFSIDQRTYLRLCFQAFLDQEAKENA